MSYKFERPVGAAADARELEYIAALHQTTDDEDESWMDGSIEATDVRNFLKSRYGINVTKQEVRDLIFAEMGGSDHEDECIDLTEVVAILLIPFLAKINFADGNGLSGIDEIDFEDHNFQSQFEVDAFRNSKMLRNQMQESRKIISDVLYIILKNATKSDAKSQPLTRNLLRRIFMYYGEHDLLQDDQFIDEMIAAAGGRELNAETFLHALTNDVQLYDVMNESRFQTHYEDVFGLVTYDEHHEEGYKANIDVDTEIGEESSNISPTENRVVSRMFTFPQIDFLADSFRSRTQYVCIWLTAIFMYIAWFKFVSDWGIQICTDDGMKNNFGCKVGNSIILWFAVMASMIFIIVPTVSLLSLGNNVYSHSMFEIIAAFAAIIILVMVPPLVQFDLGIIQTKVYEDGEALWNLLRFVLLSLGCILLTLQVCNVIRFVIPDSRLTKSKMLTILLRGSSVRSEFGIKQASVYKVHQMVKNAYDLHLIDSRKGKKKTIGNDEDEELTDDPLLNFTKVTEQREPSGGFIWAWKMLLSGNLIEKEGIWLHTKLLAGNFVQVLATFVTALFCYTLIVGVQTEVIAGVDAGINSFNEQANGTAMSDYCYSIFNPSKCFFPEGNGTALGVGLCADIIMPNTTCASNFVATAGATYDYFCDVFLDAADQLEPPASLYFNNQECPALYMPLDQLYSITIESLYTSNEDDFCAGALGVCTAPKQTENGLEFDACMLGATWKFPLPYQFEGNSCQNYTELTQLLETKAAVAAEAAKWWPPKKWMLDTSVTAGLTSALVVGASTAMSTIPSMIVTTMKFRSGAIGSLRDPYFKKYRQGLLATTFLLGASLWGTFFCSLVVFVLAYIITFLSVFQVTRIYILQFLSLLIGISVTLTVKIVLSIFLNKYNFVGFYRKHPFVANFSSLCFECWHLALTSSYIVMRIVKLFLITIFYLGRYDTPILAQGVGEIGPIKLDAFPFIFRQDLLALDAHRHPYIERLGMMYIMKLKHGDNFAKKTGSVWRLLFVFALFPWLRQYRIQNEDDDDIAELEGATGLGKSMVIREKIAALNAKVKRLTALNRNLKKTT